MASRVGLRAARVSSRSASGWSSAGQFDEGVDDFRRGLHQFDEHASPPMGNLSLPWGGGR